MPDKPNDAIREGEPPISPKAEPPATARDPDQSIVWLFVLALVIGCFLLLALCLSLPLLRLRIH